MLRKRRSTDPNAPFASSWWGVRWIEVLESFGYKSRLERGREAARRGDVVSVTVLPGGFRADLKEDETPFVCGIAVRAFPDGVLTQLVPLLAGRAEFGAALLSGHLPEEVEKAFELTGGSLLPRSPDDLTTCCSCGDETHFCRHVAAAAYVLGEKLDTDPFLIFVMRGIGKEELLTRLREARTQGVAPAGPVKGPTHMVPVEPLPDVRPELFYRALQQVATLRTRFVPPEHPDAIVARLGPPPFSDPQAADTLIELHRAIGTGAADRLREWEWRQVRGRSSR